VQGGERLRAQQRGREQLVVRCDADVLADDVEDGSGVDDEPAHRACDRRICVITSCAA
jgi:hypothetical protein